MTITDSSTSRLSSTRRTARSITRSSLKAGISTVTRRAGSTGGNTLLASRSAWISASPDSVTARAMPSVMAMPNSQRSAIVNQPSARNSPKSARAAARSLAASGGLTVSGFSPASAETGTKR